MSPFDIFTQCFKAKAISWLTTSEVPVTLITGFGNQIHLTSYFNGRRVKGHDSSCACDLPDTIPSDWTEE